MTQHIQMPSFASLRLTQRYLIVFCFYFLSMVIVIGTSGFGLLQARDSLRSLHDESMQRIVLADSISQSVLQTRLQVLLAFQHAPENPLSSLHDHPTTVHLDSAQKNIEQGIVSRQALGELVQEPREMDAFREASQVHGVWNERVDALLRKMQGGDFGSSLMAGFLADGREQADRLVALLGAFKGLQIEQANVAYLAAQERYQRSIWIFVACVLFAGLPAALMSLLLLRRMREGFMTMEMAASAIAQGDISRQIKVSGQDEIASLLSQMEKMRAHLHSIIQQVRMGADAIAGASTQVAAGTGDLSLRTEQQASSLQQTASATEELSSTVRHNADSAYQASELARSATAIAERGGEMVADVVSTMEDINGSAKKIEAIIGVIDAIAFQTNILALNAAVEAARAGEQGRGFAVVASEVRALAQRSAEAAKEIKQLIQDSVERIRSGSDVVHRTGATMTEIVQSIVRVSDIVSEIAEASREQSKGLVQISDAVSNLDGVTQQNAALVEQTSAASSSLQEQARQLANMSAQFVLEDAATTEVR